MVESDWKKRLGVVYSTNPDFKYDTAPEPQETPTLPPSAQKLIVRLEKHGRAGKQATLVEGFTGREEDLKELGRTLKVRLGIGGSASDGVILLQGDFRDKAVRLLTELGYKARRGN